MTQEEIQQHSAAIKTLRTFIEQWIATAQVSPVGDDILQQLRDLRAAKIQAVAPFSDEWHPYA